MDYYTCLFGLVPLYSLAWLANPDYFINYVALIILYHLPHLLFLLLYQSENATGQTLFFGVFYWSRTIPTNTYCVKLFPQYYALISVELGQHLRTQQEYINEQKITVTDYEHYIEKLGT